MKRIKIGNLDFPYQYKDAINAFKQVPTENIESFVIDSEYGGRYNNKIVVYDEVSDSFYSISAKRYLQQNYDPIIKLESYRLSNNSAKEKIFTKDYIFGLDKFKKKHPDNGFELFNQDNHYLELSYYVLYLQFPFIKYFLEEGYLQLVIDNMRSHGWSNFNKDGQKVNDITGLPDDIICLFKSESFDQKYSLYDIPCLAKLYRNKLLNKKQIKHLIAHYLNKAEFIEEIINSGLYTYDCLVSYIDRCADYQNLEYNRVLSMLHSNIYNARRYGLKFDLYPRDLDKENKRLNNIIESYHDAADKKSFYNVFVERKKEIQDMTYQDNNYMVVPITDADTLVELQKDKIYYSMKYSKSAFAMLIDRKEDYIIDVLVRRINGSKVDLLNNKRLNKKERRFINMYTKHIQSLCY